MSAGGSHLERPPQARLAAQVREVRQLGLGGGRRRLGARRLPFAAGQRRKLLDPLQADDLQVVDQGGFGRARRGDGDARNPAPRRLGHRQQAGNTANRAVERELAREGVAAQEVGGQLPRGDQQRDGDRQVEARPHLAQVGGRQVGRDPPERKLEARVDQRRPHPLARLAHRGVGQADDRERRQSAVDVELDLNAPGIDAEKREGPGDGEHEGEATGRARTDGTDSVTKL